MRTCPHCHSLVPFPLDACPARREVCPLLADAEGPGDEPDAAAREEHDEYPSEAPTQPGVLLADPLRTARIDQAQIRAALASGGLERKLAPPPSPPPPPTPRGARESPPPAAPITRPTPVQPVAEAMVEAMVEAKLRSRPAQPNRSALLARRLGRWSILPLFPIGFAAVAVGLVALARGRSPSAAASGPAWSGLLTGLLFGSTWLALTVWLLLQALR